MNCFFLVPKWPFYCLRIHCFDTLRIYKYLGITDLPDSIRSTFLYILIFCMHIPCVLGRTPLWKFFALSYWFLCRVWGVQRCVYYGNQYNGNFFHIPHGLQNTHNRVSCIWSFYNCKIYPNRFFIYTFDKYIFKFKLDILSFEFNSIQSFIHFPFSHILFLFILIC